MTRPLAAVVLTLLALARPAAAQAQAGLAPADSRAPNIVFVFADDLGYAELGAYGQEKIKTPNIDRLASQGMLFTQFYSASTVCAPSRGSLMTGLHTGHGYIRGNSEFGGWGPEDPEGQRPIPDQTVTMPEHLKGLGYTTGAFGKWGLGGPGSEGHPSYQGFDHFYGYLCQRVAHNYYPTHLWRNHDVDVQTNDYFRPHQRIAEPLETEQDYYEKFGGKAGDMYAAEEITAEAERWIADVTEGDDNKPFFLYFPSPIPHAALQAPQEWVEKYPADWDHEPYLGDRGYTPHPRPHAAYAAMISFFDDSVGRLIAAIEKAGQLDNTIIIVTSDNGTTFNGGVDREFFGSLANLRGFKTNLYEGGIRVPCIVWRPGLVPQGVTIDSVGHMTDWLPTLLSLAGETPSADLLDSIDGIDLSPVLTGEVESLPRSVLYWEFPEGKQQQAVLLDGRWKAIRPNLKKGLDLELYDLKADPSESSNVADTHPEIVQRAIAAMVSERTVSPEFPIPALDRE
ncbi:MAG: arylsulfatase A [Phycisphaerales bacterium]|jgi:arylsulfatase A